MTFYSSYDPTPYPNSQIAAGLEGPYTILNLSGNSSQRTQTPPHLPTPVPMSTAHQSAHPSVQPESFHVNLDKAPDNTLDTPMTQDKPESDKFIKAIDKLIQSHTSTSKPKLREPDPFNGSDPKKLHTIIFQCKLNFRDHKDLFSTKEDKVNYALSHLKGIILDCFELILLGLHDPIWLSDFNLFVTELENNFRSFDPKGEAEVELKALRMHENHQAMKYFIKFQQLASQVQWGDAAPRQQPYNGLAKCIKDDMVHNNKPNTLSSLQKLVQAID